jgi:competence protein ComEC
MTRRIASVLPGSTGGVASALITGKRGAISEEVKQAFRDSGLSHLLAIAGLHLGSSVPSCSSRCAVDWL